MIAEAAVFEAVKMRRALGDVSEVTTKDLWDRVAEDMSTKLYKSLGMDLANGTRRNREAAIDTFIQSEHLVEVAKGAGRKPGIETRARLREEADRKAVCSQLGALDEALARNGQAVTALGQEIETFLRTMRDQTADLARRGIEAAELRQVREAAAVRPSFSPSPC